MSEPRDYFNFPDALFPLSAAFALNHVPVDKVEIVLPLKHWWDLWNELDRKHPGLMNYVGDGEMPVSFRYMGLTFKAKQAS